MQLPVVMDAIEALIKARPAAMTSAPTTSSGGNSSSSTSTRGRGGDGGREKEKVSSGRGGGDRLEVRGNEVAKSASLNRSTRQMKWSSKQLSQRRSKTVWLGVRIN